MASQVTVISPTARQVTIKTRPESYLNDILDEACSRLRLDPSKYGLKHNDRELDLSNAMRHAGLTPGARLQLTLLSKSPSVVNVALQLSEAHKTSTQSSQRLTDKFPSNTSLWMVLRKFEASVPGKAASLNLTARGIPKGGENLTGSGRLFYETPIISNQGRSWRSFTDLQKTLAQLGFTKGSVLFRLAYETTNTPLEEAMQEIDQYFKAVDVETASGGVPLGGGSTEQQQQQQEQSQVPVHSPEPDVVQEPAQPIVTDKTRIASEAAADTTPTAIEGVSSRPTTVFSPPSSDIPQAARLNHDPQDFVPTVEHAKVHQALLNKASVNKRLLSDAEIAAQQAAQAEKFAATTKVDIKIRFPDQSSVVSAFSKEDTTNDLFEYTKNLLARPDEPFGLQYASNKGNRPLPRGAQKLIADVGMMNRVLVIMNWDGKASDAARKGKSLKTAVAAQGKEIEIQKPPQIVDNEPALKISKASDDDDKEKSKGKGIPKWLKLPGKK